MKRLLVVAAVAAGLLGMAMVADAATDVTNWCTSTYQLTGQSAGASGSDSAVVRVQNSPSISVTKRAKNLRTGIEADYQVSAVQGDTIEFYLIWSNVEEATADTIVLYDYIDGANLTYVAASVSDTENNATGAATESGGLIQYIGNSAAGTDPGPAAEGAVTFQVTVD